MTTFPPIDSDPDDAFARWLDGEDPADAPPAPAFNAPRLPPPAPGSPLPVTGAISTGSIGLDLALGTGGYPRGHLIELYGGEGTGKTTLALRAMARAQAAGGVVALIDAEHALDPAYARRLGVDLDDLLITQPDSGEQALGVGEYLIRADALDLLTVDSVAALTPRAELDAGVGELGSGLQATLMSQALRRWSAGVRKARTAVLLLNQIRHRPNLPDDEAETTAGGRALKFYAAQRVALAAGEPVFVPGDAHPRGVRVAARVTKNRFAPPFQTVSFDIWFGRGVDRAGELADLGRQYGVIAETDGWWRWRGHALGLDRAGARAWIADHPEAAATLLADVRSAYRPC